MLTTMVTNIFHTQKSFLFQKKSIAPLVVFRMLFGALMLFSAVRFLSYGWVYDLYIAPKHFFPYYHFEWVRPLGAYGMYALFFILILTALAILLGFWYRVAAVLYFLIFTYIELIDKTNYLNHYYFISWLAFIMIFLPSGRAFSLDVYFKPRLKKKYVEAWTIWILRFQLAMLYVFAGIAKLNSDWLEWALPLKMWLRAYSHLPIVGDFLSQTWVAYLFSWLGCLYDLTIVFLLSFRSTRIWGYTLVVVFHIATWLLFPIGVFPWVMIFFTLIFFPAAFHIKMLKKLFVWFRHKTIHKQRERTHRVLFPRVMRRRITLIFCGIFILFHLFMPFRYLLYPGYLFWTEEGFRFSWRVMLIEKVGYAMFYVRDGDRPLGKTLIQNAEYLTPNQEKMMSTQPDMILQYAHIIAKEYRKKGLKSPEVFAEVYVSLNGSRSKLLIDPAIDLAKIEEGFSHKTWILPYR